nr:signal peptidase I [Cryobacterium glaciale]
MVGRRGSNAARIRCSSIIVLSIALILGLRLWVFEPLMVSSDSMEPTIMRGSTVLLVKRSPPADTVTAGRLVIFPSPQDGQTTLKRVVAVGGEQVAIRDAVLFVNGVKVAEPFVDHSRIDGTYFGPVTVPPGHVFVLGDNRAVSIDSREFGAVSLEDLDAILLWPRN